MAIGKESRHSNSVVYVNLGQSRLEAFMSIDSIISREEARHVIVCLGVKCGICEVSSSVALFE